MRRGGETVTDLDISARTHWRRPKRNFALNSSDATIAACPHEPIPGWDVFGWLAGQAKRKFDLIVLDPPSLAKREGRTCRRGPCLRETG